MNTWREILAELRSAVDQGEITYELQELGDEPDDGVTLIVDHPTREFRWCVNVKPFGVELVRVRREEVTRAYPDGGIA